MADSSVSISGPVEIKSSSREQVSFDLMVRISQSEKEVHRDRSYWLTLYHQCLKAVQGYEVNKILTKD